MKKSQCKKILKAMLSSEKEKEWTAKDFQGGKWFVGYEASARMSDLMRMFPDLFIVGKIDRFRTLKINWNYKDLKLIQDLIKEE